MARQTYLEFWAGDKYYYAAIQNRKIREILEISDNFKLKEIEEDVTIGLKQAAIQELEAILTSLREDTDGPDF